MDLPILVDSNIYIALFRENRDPIAELLEHVSQTDLAICGMVRVEVLRGIKIPRVRERLSAFFDVLQNVPTDNRLWEETAELAWTLDRRGWIIPAADLVIAACALRIGATVLTQDQRFQKVPGLRVRNLDF